MRISLATIPAAPEQPNDDFVAAAPTAVVLLDGVGTPPGSQSGCEHGVAWFVRHLGTALLSRLAVSDTSDLRGCLADSIAAVRRRHERTCDLSHPGTPATTVVAVRQAAATLDYLVLADSVLAVDHGSSVEVVTDEREARVGSGLRERMDSLPGGTAAHRAAHRAYVEALRAYRNRPGGFWVAGGDPAAAAEAVTGSLPCDGVRALALLSDGASRLVDRFAVVSWEEAFKLLDSHGPQELLRQVRAAEDGDPTGSVWPRGKLHDDATVAYLLQPQFLGSGLSSLVMASAGARLVTAPPRRPGQHRGRVGGQPPQQCRQQTADLRHAQRHEQIGGFCVLTGPLCGRGRAGACA